MDQHGRSVSVPIDTVEKLPSQLVGTPFILLYWLAGIGLYLAVMTPMSISLAIRIAALFPEGKSASLSIIMSAGSLASMLSNPVCGYLSDKTQSRFGRRRPWMLGGVVLVMLALIGLSHTSTLFGIVLFWVLIQIGSNATLAALVAVIADVIPKGRRGLVSALNSMSTTIAILAGVVIVNMTGVDSDRMFLVPGVIALVCVMIFLLFFNEAPTIKKNHEGNRHDQITPSKLHLSSEATTGGCAWLRATPFAHLKFSMAWMNTFVLYLGSSMISTFQVYYLTDELGFTSEMVAQRFFISTAIVGVCVILASSLTGWFSDKYNRRRPLVWFGIVLYLIGIIILIVTRSFSGYLLSMALNALGMSIYSAVDQAMVIDILPDKQNNAGKDMGIFNMAITAPQVLSPLLAPLFLSLGEGNNYDMLFATAGVIVFISLIPTLGMRGVR